jgi:hypothetical protein
MRITCIGIVAILVLACAALAHPASASLVSTSFGFPVIVQSGSTTAYNQDLAYAMDLEDVSISFPTGTEGSLDFGAVNLAFPSISQTVYQVQSTSSTSFAQTNEYSEFAYPFTSVGDGTLVSLASLGYLF